MVNPIPWMMNWVFDSNFGYQPKQDFLAWAVDRTKREGKP